MLWNMEKDICKSDVRDISNIIWSHKDIEKYFRNAIWSENESVVNRRELDNEHKYEFDNEISHVVPSHKDIKEYFRSCFMLSDNESLVTANECELDIENKDESEKMNEDKENSNCVPLILKSILRMPI